MPALWGEASIRLMRVKGGRSGGVTFCQFLPPSRVTCTRPSSEPAQRTLPSTADGASVKMVAYVSTPV